MLACFDYFKFTSVLTVQDSAVKRVKQRDKKRKTVLYRQREAYPLFKRKLKKKSLALKRVDIKDSFHSALVGSLNRTNTKKGTMRFVDRSKTADSQQSNVVGHENTTAPHAFSIINVNDIIRDTDALHKF